MKKLMVLLITASIILSGCGEVEEEAITAGFTGDTATAVGTIGEMKLPIDAAPAAPSAPTDGTPYVKSVGYYSDWQLTKEIDSEKPVPAGTTIYIHIVFSEPVKHRITDNPEKESALPVLFYWVNGGITRYRIMPHGAHGEDFVSGDAKPKGGGTDDFVCKYVVKEEDKGSPFWIEVNKWSMDLEWNKMQDHYVHKTRLHLGEPEPESQITHDCVNAVDQITHGYINNVEISAIFPLSSWISDFPPPFQKYPPPESNPGDIVGQVCMPVSFSNADWSEAGYVAPVSGVTVTITKGPRTGEHVVTNEGGYYLFPDIAGDELYLRVEREYLEPKEVIVHRSRPTALQELGPNRVFYEHHRMQNTPGTILVGLRWPDAIRFILEGAPLPHDLLLITRLRLPDEMQGATSGTYEDSVITAINPLERKNAFSYSVLAHELAHARQHAIALLHGSADINGWESTPEGKAYAKAWSKDLKEVERGDWLGTLDRHEHFASSLLENAAQFCVFYWGTTWVSSYESTRDGGIRVRAPNRYRWAEKWLNKKY